MQTGFDRFIKNKNLWKALENKRLAYLGNCASVSHQLDHSFQILRQNTSLKFVCVFSPQHGWDSVEQANMIPSDDTVLQNIPVFSLYKNETRRMTSDQLNQFDVLLIDLQDVGCRIYTFVATMLYALESCAEHNKEVWVLDRPNPVGRTVEGSILNNNFQSVVGPWNLPMRYGLTLGELSQMYVQKEKLNLTLQVIKIKNYKVNQGWPSDRTWIAPSPNMTDIECAQCYSGTVLLEGTNISEGRGTTFPLKIFGFPNMQSDKIIKTMITLREEWMKGCVLRVCSFKPVFDKFKDQICSAIQIHVKNTAEFRPYRLISLFLKSVKKVHSDFDWTLPPPYEYEYEKQPIDILSGDSFLREWIDNPNSAPEDLEKKLSTDEQNWKTLSYSYHLY
ncbi:MAG: DUF1343 domain-containing protein [Bdellovibrionales bacterium]|nr:DUF1343 domain-containing protein [Bdellovibrionales bacterium]